ncbi:MAG TPA: GyrI-like domain-containing protein [bacterium]|jgi:effector-binding domain-containing protein
MPDGRYTFEITEFAGAKTLSIRTKTTPDKIGETLAQILPEVHKYATESGAQITGMPFTIYHMWEDHECEIEGGIPVAAPVDGNDRVKNSELPNSKVLTTLHQGPYEDLIHAYLEMGKYMQANGIKPTGPVWDSYITDPHEIPDPKDYQTRIYWPVA